MNNSQLTVKPLLEASQREDEIALWLLENVDSLPTAVKEVFSNYSLLLHALAVSQSKLRSVLVQLRRALGITASSEKRKGSGDPIDATAKPGDDKPKDPKEQLRLAVLRCKDLEAWHKRLAKKLRKKLNNMENAIMSLEEDLELTPEEIAESEKESAEYNERLALGDGLNPAYESEKQAFMRGGDVRVEEKEIAVSVDPELFKAEDVVARISDERTRYGFSLVVSEITVEVEKVIVKDGSSTRIISASTREIGPPKMDVTWEFLSNMAIMVAQYAMPFNRLGSMLTVPNKRFTSAKLSRMFCYTAKRLEPVYLHNFRQLSNASLLSGDDTTTKVLEFSRALKLQQDDPNSPSPWSLYASREAAELAFKSIHSPSLGVLTARELGFEFDRKDGNGQKKSLQTSLIWGRSEADDPRSAIVFYRSHIGGFGNLLSMCLSSRNPELKNLIVQSDLSTVNLISDAKLAERLNLTLAGCTSHARRPFALYEDEDPELCGAMLHFFKGLYIYEKALDLNGRNELNVRAVRNVDSRQMWEDIKGLAAIIVNKWSKATKLGAAALYILRHFAKLTAYLENPIISISNDFSERMLRMENLIQANALFRNSLEGRFALDINRSILQTAIAAEAPLQDYLNFVLRAAPAEVAEHPENFTALSYIRMKSQPS